MTDKIYMLHPGNVVSKHDGQTHYISSEKLVDLYGVSMSQCVVYNGSNHGLGFWKSFIHLRPRRDGNYSLN